MNHVIDTPPPSTSLADHKRLKLLQTLDPHHPWTSPDDELHCVLCERTISGRTVRVVRQRNGTRRLACSTPGCVGTPAEWVHSGNPLISEEAWHDWARLITTLHEPRGRRKMVRRVRQEIGLAAAGWRG